MSTSKQISWWAASSKRARHTALGATAIVAALLATSAFVWSSPDNPVREAILGQEELTASDKLLAERNALLSQLIDLKSDLAALDESLTATEAEKAAIQQALWTAQGQLDAATTASAPKTSGKTTTKTTATTAATIAPAKAAIVNPAAQYFGMFTEQAPFNWATYDATAAKVGYTPNTVGYFGGWDEDFRASAVTRAWSRGTLPILTWESRPILAGNDEILAPEYSLPQIIAGAHDDYLRKYAQDVIATGLPLGIRLDHEMNGVWYPWSETDSAGNSLNGNSKGDYVKMWQHVHDIFEQEGANSLVVWIWAPNITNNLPATHKTAGFLADLYPGDEYVDWVGLSGYLRPAYKPENDFSFDYTFGASLDDLRGITSKPIFLAEVGASETGGHKATWITSLFEGLADPANSDVIGFSWFSLAVTSYTEGVRATNDWRIDSRADSLAAFSAGFAVPGSRFALATN